MPDAHSGEGIFFTARSADIFVLRSHRIRLEWDNARADTFVSDERFTKGTKVEFTVRRDARRNLESVFAEFAPEEYDYRFEKTRIRVSLVQPQYVSRSEARRLTANLEKFRTVVLDFKGVRSVGQGFMDGSVPRVCEPPSGHFHRSDKREPRRHRDVAARWRQNRRRIAAPNALDYRTARRRARVLAGAGGRCCAR
jgi:hypothetical protein